MRLGPLLSVAAALLGPVCPFANPGACSGDCWSHDPCVVPRDDGTYFRFETGNKIGIYKAPDLTGPWTLEGSALPAGSKIDLAGNKDLWAPDVHKVGNQYIMYYSVSTMGSRTSAIGYATSPSMEKGTWTDRGSTGVSSNDNVAWNAIDANLIQTPKGNMLNFGSFRSNIFQVSMTADGTQAVGNPRNIIKNHTAPAPIEGSFVFQRQGTFWALFSSGKCCDLDKGRPPPGDEYKIFACRSSSANGPFTDRDGKDCADGGGTLLLASHDKTYAPGGQGVYTDKTRGTVLYYHYMNPDVGIADSQSRFGWNVIGWGGGWPSV